METKELHYLCDKDTFLKLKEINRFLSNAKCAYGTWYRAKRKDVYKKKLPSLKKYSMFIEEYTKGKDIGKIDGTTKGERSHKSRWLINEPDTGSYKYLETHYDVKDWACLHTHYIDVEYSRARMPITEEYAKENPLKISKEKINELYNEIEKFYDKLKDATCPY
jgi:hypothetical protein